MTTKRQTQTSKINPKPREITVHARLSAETVAKLDAVARKNNITRAAVVAIGSVRIAESGL